MVRVWFGAGLEPAIPARRRWLLPVAAFGLAMVLAGPAVVGSLRNRPGDPYAILLVFSGLGDIASITLLAPMLLIALALRGGRLAWPWGLLAAGELCWLLYDLTSPFARMDGATVAARTVSEGVRMGACLLYASAGLAQRLVLRPPPPVPPSAAAGAAPA